MGNATPDPVYNLEAAPNSFPSWQFIPPNSGPLPSNTKVITTNHTGEAMDDLVKELRALGANDYMLRAADEIERLRKERDEVRRNLCFTEAAVLSFGPNGVPYHPSVAHKIAKEDYGWDCFKEQP